MEIKGFSKSPIPEILKKEEQEYFSPARENDLIDVENSFLENIEKYKFRKAFNRSNQCGKVMIVPFGNLGDEVKLIVPITWRCCSRAFCNKPACLKHRMDIRYKQLCLIRRFQRYKNFIHYTQSFKPIPLTEYKENYEEIKKWYFRLKNHTLRKILKKYPLAYGLCVLDLAFYDDGKTVRPHFHIYLNIPEIQDNPEKQKIFFRPFRDKRGNRILKNPLTLILQNSRKHFLKRGLKNSYKVMPSPKSVNSALRYFAVREAGLYDHDGAYYFDKKGRKNYHVSLKRGKSYRDLREVIKEGRYKTIPEVFQPYTAFKLFHKKRFCCGVNVTLPSLAILLKDILTDKLTDYLEKNHPKLLTDGKLFRMRPFAKMLKDPPPDFFLKINFYLKANSMNYAATQIMFYDMADELERKAKRREAEKQINPFGFISRKFREETKGVNFLQTERKENKGDDYYRVKDFAKFLNKSETVNIRHFEIC